MNIENTRKALAYFAELDEGRFDMRNWFADYLCVGDIPAGVRCGTVACIAGHVQLAFAETEEEQDMLPSVFSQGFLGLTGEEAVRLFYGQFMTGLESLSDITLDDAVEELKRMVQS